MSSNVFAELPTDLPEELIETLQEGDGLRIERIVSQGHASPEGFWYDQDRHEWVLVLQESARLRLEGVETPVELKAGDYLNIPAHQRHRVDWTDPSKPTIWLAVHCGDRM